MATAAPELVPTDEQNDLRAVVRRLMDDRSPPATVRSRAGSGAGLDRTTWLAMAEQVGLQGLTIPERHGGIGQGPVEAAIVFEELGRSLYPGPYLSTVGLAVPAILAADDEPAAADLLPGIAAGSTIATVAVTESDGRWDTGRERSTTARRAGGRWLMDGAKSFVLDGLDADLLLVTAATGSGTSLFAVDAAAAGVTRHAMESLDLARSLARIELRSVPGRLLGVEGRAEPVVATVLDRALVAVAAEQVGGIGACLDMSVGYAMTRRQFGRPIGAFQAVSHKLVDMLAEAELGRAAVRYAAACDAAGSAEFGVAARVAAAYCARGYRRVTTETIQVHGGIGFTWEHDAHLYHRRAWSTQQLFGDPATHWLAIAERVGL